MTQNMSIEPLNTSAKQTLTIAVHIVAIAQIS
jgi:hypothetical protein